MASSCEDYRLQQQLLALKKRLAEKRLTADKRQEIESLIEELERELKMGKGRFPFSLTLDKKSLGAAIGSGGEGDVS